MVLAVEVLGGLAIHLVHLNCPAVDGLELCLFGAEGNAVGLLADTQAFDVNQSLDTTQTRRIRKLQELAESCALGINREIRKDATDGLHFFHRGVPGQALSLDLAQLPVALGHW